MYKLDSAKRAQVLSALVEGTSIRAINRMTGVSRDTISMWDMNDIAKMVEQDEIKRKENENGPCGNGRGPEDEAARKF